MRSSIFVASWWIAVASCTVDVTLARDPAADAHGQDVGDDADASSSADSAETSVPDAELPDAATSDAGADAAPQQWLRVFVPTNADLRGIWGTSSRDVWVVGDRGTLLHWTGTAWFSSPSPAGAVSYRDIWGSAANDVWAVGVDLSGLLSVAHYDGRSWFRWPLPPLRYAPRAIFGTARDDVWIVGGPFEYASDSVLRWDGARWNIVRTGGRATRYLDVGGTSPNDLWIVALDDTLLRWRGAFELDAATLPVAVVSFELGLFASGPEEFWVTADAGILHRYMRGTWTSVDTGTRNTLRNVWGVDGRTLWAVGNRGTIVRFDGASWSVAEEVTPRTLLSVWASSASDAWVIGEGGTVLHSVR